MGKFRYSITLFREFIQFARTNKIFWIVPLVLALGLMISIIVIGQSSTPFIYTLF